MVMSLRVTLDVRLTNKKEATLTKKPEKPEAMKRLG